MSHDFAPIVIGDSAGTARPRLYDRATGPFRVAWTAAGSLAGALIEIRQLAPPARA